VRTELRHEDGQADGYDEANGRFSQFCERAKEKQKRKKKLRKNQM
jgi:hypothetical protein